MSITSQVAKSGPFVGASYPQAVPTGFSFQQSSDLLVINVGSSGAPHDPPLVMALGSDYTVTGGGYNFGNGMQSGTVTLQAGGANSIQVGDIFWFLRNVPINQIVSALSSPFSGVIVEEALDKQATISQMLQEQANRSLRFEQSETYDGTLNLTARKGNVLGFDANGAVAYVSSSSLTGAVSATVSSIGSLRAVVTAAYIATTQIQVLGYYTPGDGGGGLFYFTPGSSATDNGGTVIAPNAGTGRWFRVINDGIFNVRHFGAKGDNATDDTTAIQAAITAAQTAGVGARVILPFPGTSAAYKTTAPLVITIPIKFGGQGSDIITILANGLSAGQAVLSLDGTVAPNFEEAMIENITLRSNNSLPDGIILNNISNSDFSNVFLRNLKNGITLTGARCFSNTFYRVIENAPLTGNCINFTSYTGGGQQTFISCSFAANNGLSIDSASAVNGGLELFGCIFEASTTNAIVVSGSSQGLGLYGCRFEKCQGVTTVNINPTAGNFVYGLSINACYFETDVETYAINLGGSSGQVRGFTISNNFVQDYNTFVRLNGEGQSGFVLANRATNVVNVINGIRNGVTCWSNEGFTTVNGLTLTTPLTMISTDRGDNNVTLVVGTDAIFQQFNTTLTANRAVTLPVSANNGDYFRVTRTGLGAFTLNVGGVKTIPSATSAYVDVMWNGTAWVETAYGTNL